MSTIVNNYFKVSPLVRTAERFFFFNDRDRAATQQAYDLAKEYWKKFNGAHLRLWRKPHSLSTPMNQVLTVGEVPDSVPMTSDIN